MTSDKLINWERLQEIVCGGALSNFEMHRRACRNPTQGSRDLHFKPTERCQAVYIESTINITRRWWMALFQRNVYYIHHPLRFWLKHKNHNFQPADSIEYETLSVVFCANLKPGSPATCELLIIKSKYPNSPHAKSMRSDAHHVSKSPAQKLKTSRRMRQKFPKRPSAYQIILLKQQHTDSSPLPAREEKHLFFLIRWIPSWLMTFPPKTRESHTSKHTTHTHAYRPTPVDLSRGDAAHKPGERLASKGQSVRHGRRRAKTHPGPESPKSHESKEARILPGYRSFLSGNWRQRTRDPHLIV